MPKRVFWGQNLVVILKGVGLRNASFGAQVVSQM